MTITETADLESQCLVNIYVDQHHLVPMMTDEELATAINKTSIKIYPKKFVSSGTPKAKRRADKRKNERIVKHLDVIAVILDVVVEVEKNQKSKASDGVHPDMSVKKKSMTSTVPSYIQISVGSNVVKDPSESGGLITKDRTNNHLVFILPP